MSDVSDQPNENQVRAFSDKLVVFKTTLNPQENALFTGMMVTAQQALQPEVAGYDDGGGASDLVTKLNWDALTALSLDPSTHLSRGAGLEHDGR